MNTNLTSNEMKAAMLIVRSCFEGMGGARPSDLADDEFTWVVLGDLMEHGYSRYEAAGTIGALLEKGFLEGEMPSNKITEMNMTTEAWKYLDTLWDAYKFN